ncbi:multidrug efflux ABC transporter LmrCD subunit C [Lactococcus lactis subsp. cremoris]|uniref:ABC transporter ATP binding and permease protein n=1 Tax=Lactococcus lactis subsp. lactis (strain IL1403) TaxID=272623 RepID=Q9CIP6_LACLA|nr:multidrug efflux ABC transporter LmrCD subunit C [Lactococcus lactis]MRM74989.1 multidrug efflux ABC transporter LmrCD subunit C [Lactococcus cremoris]AAK04408.1 ABC transporter ATP binding and permease protein [Lactococcus lactis subsp. lactis Il1403]AYV51713.1 multidrug efflux ABC transporter LmrCD subunit C [Lactococcus lactis]AYV53980.1 multidrug efflux ABC transporter LmrCD subunit C [Lactococcus lactis]MRL46232.1 multidrug efflux ABC transporter LmrCD subunit C [Lactococcus lactis sub
MKHKWVALFSIVSTFIYAGVQLYQPQIMKRIMTVMSSTTYSRHQMADKVSGYGVELLVVAGIGIIFAIFSTLSAARIAQEIGADVREATYKKINTFSYENIEKFNAGNLVVRMTNDVTQVQNLMMMVFQILMRIPVLLIGAVVLSITTLPRLWWITVLLIVLIVLVTAVLMGRMGPHFMAFQKLMDRINAIAKQNLRGSRVVKSFVQEKNQIKDFDETSDELYDHNWAVGKLFSAMIPLFTVIAQGVIWLAIYFVSTFVTESTTVAQDSIGGIATFMTYMGMIMFAIIMGGMISMFASRGMVSIGRINEVLNTDPAMKFDENAKDEVLSGSVKFDHVSFSYPNDEEPTLKDISFEVEPGQMVGIVGATGAGKSTLAQLIPRLFDPTEGTVSVGGKDLKTVSRGTLKKNISIVLQKAILFSGTIAGNIKQGKADATDEEMTRAARIAQAAEFITTKDGQYDSEVEERGNNFSGGQKQRLSITRGVVKNPNVLILDDSTSALDAKSEKLVQEALNKDLKDTTTIIIAQKISSVVHADNILVLDQGKLVGQGTHQELVAENKIYQEIYDTQKAQED